MEATPSPISAESNSHAEDARGALPPEFGHCGLAFPRAALQLQWIVSVPSLSLEDGAMGCNATLVTRKGVPHSAGVPQGSDTMEEHPN